MCFLRNRARTLAAALLAASALGWLLPGVNALDQVGFTLQQLEAEGWRAEQLRFTLDWPSPENAAYRLEIGRLEWREPRQVIEGIRLDCRQGSVTDLQISCHQGRVHLPWKMLDDPAVQLSFTYHRASGVLVGTLQDLALAGGRVAVDLHHQASRWEVATRGQGLNLQTLPTLIPLDLEPLEGWSYEGKLQLQARFSGRQARLLQADWQMEIAQLTLADELGEYAAEGLAGSMRGRLEHASAQWRIQSQLSLEQGELLTPAFYLNPQNHPLDLQAEFSLDEALQEIRLEDASFKLEGILSLIVSAVLDLGKAQPVQWLSLKSDPVQTGELYRELLQPVLVGTPLGSYELEGNARLTLQMDGEMLAVDLSLEDFHLDDAASAGTIRRMGLYGVRGRLHWNQGGASRSSWLSWQSGHLLERIGLGAGRLEFAARDRELRLIRQLRVPIIDGALVVDRLDIQDLGEPEQQILFDGIIEPMSMSALSQALDWQPLSGKLSGMIPGLTYRQGQFNIDGVLLVRMFDGDILIRQLRLQDLFGVYPQLQADIELRSLDLQTLTETFSFGRITGRLNGYVRDLRLEAWQPVAFDARFYTPEGDESRRRISQRAVDNISNLGGAGLSGSLARSFLGMFEEFRYKRIGIGCRLDNETCEMVGAGEAKQGYYLVEGSGVPRIDIIGYNRTADWSRLVEQLKQITESGSPVIE